MVFSGLVTAWRLATCPTRRLPSFVNATTEGVVRPPSLLVITVGSPPSITATTELVVPRSIPIILLIVLLSTDVLAGAPHSFCPFRTRQRRQDFSDCHGLCRHRLNALLI